MIRSVLFDASRLLSRVERTAPTGVDRVCLAYAEWLLSLPDVTVTPVRGRNDQLVVVDERWFRDCVKMLRARWTGGTPKRPLSADETRLMTALAAPDLNRTSVISPAPKESARPPGRRRRVWKQFVRSQWSRKLPEGSLYFNIGHTGIDDPRLLIELRERGIAPIVFLHDLIPITHPEFCRPGDDEKHRGRVVNALNNASQIIVNSQYTADELIAFAASEGIAPPPIHAVHLGLEPTFLPRAPAATSRPYFLHIGTIEARKNLAFLLTVWRRLEERMGDATPQLVLVGRYGWENEAVLDHLERSPAIQGLVHQAADLPDSVLATLMSNARALLAPSSVEGFDLPAVEASAVGLPLIASDIAAHRELVPNAQLIDPLDGLGWLDALERATKAAPDAVDFSPPTWTRHFEQVSRHVGLTT